MSKRTVRILGFMLTAVLFLCTACLPEIFLKTLQKAENESQTEQWADYSSEGLQLSFSAPADAVVKTDPSASTPMRIQIAEGVDIEVRLWTPAVEEEQQFLDYMAATYETAEDFRDMKHEQLSISGHPALLSEYKWTLMKKSLQVLDLQLMNGSAAYSMVCMLPEESAGAYADTVRTLLHSITVGNGPVNLALLETGVLSPITAGAGGGAQNTPYDDKIGIPTDTQGWVDYRCDALRLQLLVPPYVSIRTYEKDSSKLLAIEFGDSVDISVRLHDPDISDPAAFADSVYGMFDGMGEYTKDFQELNRDRWMVGDSPAVLMEYRFTVMKTSMQAVELQILHNSRVYQLLGVFKAAKESAYREMMLDVYRSAQFTQGDIDLSLLSPGMQTPGSGQTAGDIQAGPTAAPSTPMPPQPTPPAQATPWSDDFAAVPIALTSHWCMDDEIMATVLDEYGQTVAVADWMFLKEAYGDMLPSVLAGIDLADTMGAWVLYKGNPRDGNRQYFIQRFDGGPPSNFYAYDHIGSIYLGSWYGIELPVLVYAQ